MWLNSVVEYHILEIYTCFKTPTVKTQQNYFQNGGTSMKYYFILIAILEADLSYNKNNNIVYNDTNDGVLTEYGFTYI